MLSNTSRDCWPCLPRQRELQNAVRQNKPGTMSSRQRERRRKCVIQNLNNNV